MGSIGGPNWLIKFCEHQIVIQFGARISPNVGPGGTGIYTIWLIKFCEHQIVLLQIDVV